MERYEKYKDSGIEWIGEIPEHWEVKKLKYISSSKPSSVDKKSKDDEDKVFLCNYVDVYKNEFISSHLEFMEATASKEQIDKFKIEKGDVIITKDSESANDIGIPAFVDENMENVVCGYHLTHIKPIRIDGEYLFRQFQCKFQRSYFEVTANGVTRYGLNVDSINSIPVLLPKTKTEQENISKYLRTKTAQIDRIIANKQRLIAHYEEEKQAIINQAVTNGLDPNVPMKPSGVEWLGDIPEHWEVKKLKWVISEKLKYGANESAELEERNLPRYIRITDFGDDGILKDETFKSLPFDKANDYILEEGDVLFARSGATVGKTFQFKNYNGVACFAGYLIKAKPNKKYITSDFLYYYTKSLVYERWKQSNFNQSTIQNIGADKYAYLEIPIPLIEEQSSIVDNIEKQCTQIDILIEKYKKQIDLFQEYRTTLISEVVTGKVKV